MGNITALITGATSGIGRAGAFALGKAGYNLILTGRSENKGKKLEKIIHKKFGVNADFLKTDISSISEVKELADTIKEKYDKIDVLVNNAGARFYEYLKSRDGIELTFATNYIGHFVLTLSLLDLLKKPGSARIINMASSSHWKAKIDLDEIAGPKNYDRRLAYGASKLAMVLFTYELSGKLNDKNVTVNALDPGGVATNLGRNNGLEAWARHYVSYLIKFKLAMPSTAADAVLYLASSKELKDVSGKYFFRRSITKSSEASYNKKTAEDLWNLSLKIGGITFN